MRPVRVTKRPKKDKERNHNSGKLAIHRDHPRCRIEIKFLHGGWSSGGSSKFRISSKSVKRFRSCGGRNLPFPIDLAIGLYNSLYYRTSRDAHYLLLLSLSVTVLQAMLDKCSEVVKVLSLEFNAKKSHCITIGKK